MTLIGFAIVPGTIEGTRLTQPSFNVSWVGDLSRSILPMGLSRPSAGTLRMRLGGVLQKKQLRRNIESQECDPIFLSSRWLVAICDPTGPSFRSLLPRRGKTRSLSAPIEQSSQLPSLLIGLLPRIHHGIGLCIQR